MKFLFTNGCLLAILVSFGVHSFLQSQSLPEGVTVELKPGSLFSVLSQIQDQTTYSFAYNSDEINDDQEVTVSNSKQKLVDVLDELAKTYSLTFNDIGKVIYIKSLSGTTSNDERIGNGSA